jgi:hypothetical protein
LQGRGSNSTSPKFASERGGAEASSPLGRLPKQEKRFTAQCALWTARALGSSAKMAATAPRRPPGGAGDAGGTLASVEAWRTLLARRDGRRREFGRGGPKRGRFRVAWGLSQKGRVLDQPQPNLVRRQSELAGPACPSGPDSTPGRSWSAQPWGPPSTARGRARRRPGSSDGAGSSVCPSA